MAFEIVGADALKAGVMSKKVLGTEGGHCTPYFQHIATHYLVSAQRGAPLEKFGLTQCCLSIS